MSKIYTEMFCVMSIVIRVFKITLNFSTESNLHNLIKEIILKAINKRVLGECLGLNGINKCVLMKIVHCDVSYFVRPPDIISEIE